MTPGLARLAIRSLARKKLRVAFTALAVATVIMAFVLIRAVQTAWNNTSELTHTDRIVTQDSISYSVLLPKQYVAEIGRLAHVERTTFYNWTGAREIARPTEFFPALAVDHASYFEVFSEMVVSGPARAAWSQKRNAAIVGELLAARMGWKVGDRLTLESGFYPEQPRWEFEVVGFYGTDSMSVNRSTLLVRWDYFNELVRSSHTERIGWIVTVVDDPARAAEVAHRIDAHFENRSQQTFTQSERAFAASFGEGMDMMMNAMTLACFALLAIMVLLVGNTIAMGVRERTQEYAMLRAIGFTSRQVASSIVAEAVVLGSLGALLGLALSYPLLDQGLGRWIGANLDAFLPYFRVGPTVSALAFAASIAVSTLAAILPAFRMFNLSVTSALRHTG